MEFSCPFGTAEKLLREKEYPSEPDKEIEVDGKLQPDYFVTAIVDRNTGTLLYDEECDFAECVFHWQEEKFTLALIEAQKCIVEGIEVREHENTMQTARGRGNH